MKKLIVSLKTSTEVLNDFKNALRDIHRKVKKRLPITPHYEISFDTKPAFDRFVRNIFVLQSILTFKPKSIYELAKITEMDVSNLNKIILFFEEVGAIKVKTSKVSGRTVRRPIVEYDTVEFKLAA